MLAGLWLISCGGGGSGDGSGGPPRGPNRDPVANVEIPDQLLVVNHPYEFDVSQGGQSFTDPDGDRLEYRVSFSPSTPPGLSVSGSVISGIPTKAESLAVSVRVSDGRGGEVSTRITLRIAPNSSPVPVTQNPDRVLAASEIIDLDVTHGNQAFLDADGDPLTYVVTFAASGHGLSISGTRIVGSMTSVGLVRVRVTAFDGFGGTAEDSFSLALPAAEPGEPNLPSPSYVYRDSELDLPLQLQISREHGIPFPDTTPRENPTTNAGATLGRVLFYDKRLSITNTMSCGTCHEQSRGFAAAERFSVGVQETPQARNAMSLGNVRYNELNQFFWDSRVFTLEGLVPIPIESPEELGQPMDMLLAKLSATSFYAPLFEAAFGTPEITKRRIQKALAQFMRSMISYQSRFDEAMLQRVPGELPDPALVLDAQEMRGLQVATESNCFACHDNAILIVTVPRNNGLDGTFTDPGQGNGRFRPPSLRNIRASAPYMHDGRFATLREVIDHYDQGVQDSPHLDSELRVDRNSGPPRRLNLSVEDKDALEALLDSLTDEVFLADPRFSDPFQ